MRVKIYKLATKWVPKIPKRISYGVAGLAGDLIWFLSPQVRKNFAHNQQRALGPNATAREISQSSRHAIRNLAKIYIDEFRLPAMSEEEIRQSVIIHGLEHLEEAHAKGKGVILISAHYGAPHVVSQMLTVLGYPTTVVVEHTQPEELFQVICEMRSSHGLRLLPIDGSLIGLIRTLRKEKGLVGLVMDRDISGTGIRIPFLGEETSVPDGAVKLAIRVGAPIVLAYCRRRPDYRYEAFVEPPFYFERKPADLDQAVREGTIQIMQRMGAFIRQQPSQWVMSVPLWK